MPEFSLHPLDLFIIGSYLVLSIGLGLYLARRHDTAEDYFLAGRRMLWPVIGISLFASNISSTTLIGLAGDAYAGGIAVFNYEWMASIVLVFYAIFILPTIFKARLYTMPEFLERRFSVTARRYFSLLTIFLNIVIDTAGSLYAGGLFLQLIFPELPIGTTIAFMAIIAGIYTIAGGLKAVMYTDVLQTVLLLTGAIVLSWTALDRVGGWEAVLAAVPAEKLSLIRPADDPSVPWPGLVTGVFLLGFYFWCTNQFMAQRFLSARSLRDGRLGGILAGFLKLPVLFLMVLPGSFAILLYPQLERPDLVYPTLVFDLLPVGMVGIVTGGFIAALLSQIDSTLNSASTLISVDFIKRRWPEITPHQLMRVGQGVTFAFMVLSVLWAPQIVRFDSLFRYLQTVLSYAVPPVLALFLFGFFSARIGTRAANLTLYAGTSAGVLLFVCIEVLGLFSLHFLYLGPLLFAFSSLVLWGATPFTPAPDREAIAELLFQPGAVVDAPGVPLWRDYRLWSGILLLTTAWIVFAFR